MLKTPRVPPYCRHKRSNRVYCRIAGRFMYLGAHGSPERREAYAAVVADFLIGRPIDATAGRS